MSAKNKALENIKDTGLHKDKIPYGGRLSEKVEGKSSMDKEEYRTKRSIFRHKEKGLKKSAKERWDDQHKDYFKK